VNDSGQAGRAKQLAERFRLRSPERAQVESVEVPVEDAMRVFDVRVPDEIDPVQLLVQRW
jgi:hypothetical protein